MTVPYIIATVGATVAVINSIYTYRVLKLQKVLLKSIDDEHAKTKKSICERTRNYLIAKGSSPTEDVLAYLIRSLSAEKTAHAIVYGDGVAPNLPDLSTANQESFDNSYRPWVLNQERGLEVWNAFLVLRSVK